MLTKTFCKITQSAFAALSVLALSPCALSAAFIPPLEYEIDKLKIETEKLNEFCSWEPVRLIEKGDVIRVLITGTVKRDIENEFYYLWLSENLTPVSRDERIKKLSHLSMQWGIYTWQCSDWLKDPCYREVNSLAFHVEKVKAGAPLLLSYLNLATGRAVLNPLDPPTSLEGYTVELEYTDEKGLTKSITLAEDDFIYRINHGLKYPELKGIAMLHQSGVDQGYCGISFYSPTEALASGSWTVEGKKYERQQFILRLKKKD